MAQEVDEPIVDRVKEKAFGGKPIYKEHRYTRAEVEARVEWLIDKWRSAERRTVIASEFKETFGVDLNTSKFPDLALEELKKRIDVKAEDAARVQVLRYEDIYNKAMKENRLETALKALDGLNKLWKLYDAPQVVINQELRFKFGDERPDFINITPQEE